MATTVQKSNNADEVRKIRFTTLVSGSFGNFVEWYDWGIFAVLATVFSAQIFHSGSDIASLLQTLATFAVGFAARPLGAVLLSPLGDRLGRKRLLVIAILMMSGSSLVLGIIPTYDVIGPLAPIIFVLARVVQGISAGAGFQSGASFIVEHAPEEHRGAFGSVTLLSCILGSLAATGVGALVTNLLPQDALESWGWRLPFVLGALLGVIGLYMRRRVPETPAFESVEERSEIVKSPLVEAFKHHKLTMLRVFAISVYTGTYYLWTVFLPTYAHLASGLPLSQTLLGGIVALMLMAFTLPLYGRLSDRIGRKPLLVAYCVGMILFTYPMLKLLEIPNFGIFLAVDIVGCFIIGLTSATQSTAYCEMIPADVRTTVMGVPYNVSSALVGGTMPLIATSLLNAGHGPAVAFVVIGISIFSLIVLLFTHEMRGNPLEATEDSPPAVTTAI